MIVTLEDRRQPLMVGPEACSSRTKARWAQQIRRSQERRIPFDVMGGADSSAPPRFREPRGLASQLDRVADVAQDRRDLAAEEDECDDRDDGDQGKNQGIFRETLTLGPVELTAQRREQPLDGAHSDLLLSTLRGLGSISDTLPRPSCGRYAPTGESHMGLWFPYGNHRSSIVWRWPRHKHPLRLPATGSR